MSNLGNKVVLADMDDIEQVQSSINEVDQENDTHREEASAKFLEYDEKIGSLETEMEEVKKSVSDGKTLVANAITNKGVNTAIDAEFEVMATNIASITTIEQASADMTATAADMLNGKTAIVKGEVVTGSMADNGAINQTLSANGSYTIPEGYHNGNGKVSQNLTTKGATTYTPGTANQTIAADIYLTGDQTIVGDSNLVAGNIAKGKSIFGITGTYDPGSFIDILGSSTKVMKAQFGSAGQSTGFANYTGTYYSCSFEPPCSFSNILAFYDLSEHILFIPGKYAMYHSSGASASSTAGTWTQLSMNTLTNYDVKNLSGTVYQDKTFKIIS